MSFQSLCTNPEIDTYSRQSAHWLMVPKGQNVNSRG